MKRRIEMTIRPLAIIAASLLLLPAQSHAQHRADSTYNFGLKQLAISAGALSVVVLVADSPIAKGLHESASPGTLSTARALDRFGEPSGMFPIIGGIALVGIVSGKHTVTRTALHAVEAIVLGSLTAQVGKHVIGRARPYADPDLDGLDFLHFLGDPALPSGHASAAFALATTLGDAIDKPWARIGLYTLAAGTGWARLAEEQHWLSDVIAGAAIGFVSSRFVSGRIRVFGLSAPTVIVGPRQIRLGWTF